MSTAQALPKLRVLHFEVTGGPSKGKTFSLSKPVVTLGRSSENDIPLESDLKVSRTHVEISQYNGLISIQNKNDKNTMMVNGQVVSFHPMNAADCVLRVGDSEIRIRTEGGAQRQMHQPLYMPNSGMAMPPPPPMSGQNSSSASKLFSFGKSGGNSSGNNQSRYVFYGLIVFLVIIGLTLMNGTSTKKVAEELRKSDDVETDIATSKENLNKLEDNLKKSGKDKDIYLTVHQFYLKGFRDYQNGQYGRAILSFQTVLAINSAHELARKYEGLSRRKLDERVRFEMATGLKYKSQGNFRMCAAAYKNALSYMVDTKDPSYLQADQSFRECELLQKDRP